MTDEPVGGQRRSPVDDRPELRLALAMRGGVSLAVWMGGACAEIDALRRAADPAVAGAPDDPATELWREVMEQSPYSRVVVDVIAGASAGGLNGVVFAAAIRHGFPMAALLDVWREVAGLEKLVRVAKPWRSLFDGDLRFLDEIHARLRSLVGEGSTAHARTGAVDLQLTATLVEPVSQPTTSPTDEALRRNRSTARFHFRQDPASVFPRSDLERDGLARLAVAARSSASFPFAFEASAVRSSRPERFRLGRGEPGPAESDALTGDGHHRWVDCRGTFSESRGAATGRGAELHADDFVVADGGILDNIPISRALDAVRSMPASGPTRRVLVYMHPTGPAAGGSEQVRARSSEVDRRGPRALLSGLIASRLQGESIDEDLERLEQANRNLRLRRQARRAAADLLGVSDDPLELARQQIGAYLEQRAVVDADEVRSLLRDPLVVLGEDPFPLDPSGIGDDRWRAPLALWPAELRVELDEVLRTTFRGRLDQRPDLGSLLTGGLGPLLRSIDLLAELARAIEAMTEDQAERAAVGATKAELYRMASLVRELDRMRRIGWVTVAGRLIEHRNDGTTNSRPQLGDWITTALDDLNGLLVCDAGEADALVAEPASRGRRDLDAARRAFISRCEEGLQRLTSVDGLGTGDELTAGREPAHPVDIREAVTARLGQLAAALVARWPARNADAERTASDPARVDEVIGAALIRRVLDAPATGPVDHRERLAALEVLLVREHLLGPSPGVPISFVRMSAAAPTIDARRFRRLHEVSEALAPEHTDHDHLLPDVKLAGNELSNFAAFFDERWRTNDWYWGRMDAVPTLVDLALGIDQGAPGLGTAGGGGAGTGGEDDEARSRAEAMRRSLVLRRQHQIASSMAAGDDRPLDEVLAEWDVGLETLTVPGARSTRRSMAGLGRVGALVVGGALGRPRIAWVLQFPAGWFAGRAARPRGGIAGRALVDAARRARPRTGGDPR